MAYTYILISSVTVGSGGAASIDFTNIPQTYTDLTLYVSARNTKAITENEIKLTFNNNTSNYTEYNLRGSGSSVISQQFNSAGIANVFTPGANAGSGIFGNIQYYIANYSGSNHKPLFIHSTQENNTSAAYSHVTSGKWADSSAITSIKLVDNNGNNFAQYSTAYLYGIKNS